MAKYKFGFFKDIVLINTIKIERQTLSDAKEQATFMFIDLIRQGFRVEPLALPNQKTEKIHKFHVA